MARGRKGHVYLQDSKTGELFAPEKVEDGDMELVHGLLEDESDAKALIDYAKQQYGKDRAMLLNVFRDGKKVVDGTEYFTEQAEFDQYTNVD